METGFIVRKPSPEELHQREVLMKDLNALVASPCPGCRQPLGFAPETTGCEHPLHVQTHQTVHETAEALNLGCCDRCGEVQEHHQMIVAQSHIFFEEHEGPLEFCGHCHFILHDER